MEHRLRNTLSRWAHDRRISIPVQLAALAILVASLAWAVRDVWPDAAPRLRHADPVDLAIACVVIAAYYLLFVVGWLRILAAMGIRIRYRVALQSEMVSMLAKYIPGGVWTPAARVVAVRRFGVTDTPIVLASIALEAGLSAVAGVLVLFASLPLVGVVDVPYAPLLAFAGVVTVLLHPRIFRPIALRVLRPFGAEEVPALRYRTTLGLLAFYAVTWPLGGVALFFLIRGVGGDPDVAAIPFLGGTSAVGAIVAVLAVFAPSGLGVREASMYGLILAVASEGVALGATVLNRLAITVVEAALLLIGMLALRRSRDEYAGAVATDPASGA
ncbi:MAG: lysylphosphatidylglycerol synthase transmembrane domain-containing protein [Gaiellaceae bacterium]